MTVTRQNTGCRNQDCQKQSCPLSVDRATGKHHRLLSLLALSHLRVPDVRPIEGREGHPVGRLNYGLGLAVQAELAALAVASPELLARHREDAAGAVAHEDGVYAGSDEHPAR